MCCVINAFTYFTVTIRVIGMFTFLDRERVTFTQLR